MPFARPPSKLGVLASLYIHGGGTTETIWWYYVKVTMENVPLEAWNEDKVKLILGNKFILDRLNNSMMSGDPLSSSLAGWGWRIRMSY